MFETDCTIAFNGREFTAGGAWRTNASLGAYVASDDTITSWHGERLGRIITSTYYRGNFCKMRAIRVRLTDGSEWYGRYCPEWSELCRMRRAKGDVR